ncbi:MAG: nucleoside phosphorylase [Chloroflexota bacterium]
MSNNTPLPITGLVPGEVPASMLVCGDPARAAKTAAFFKNAQLLSERREYHIYRGHFGQLPVAVCSHGVGAAGAAIAFEELIAAGARRLIRIGTCGGLRPDVRDGDLVVASAAVNSTGYGRQVAPAGYPAVADWRVTRALAQGAAGAGRSNHTGIVLTNDHFYGGVETPETPHYPTMIEANVLAVEMECAALFLVGSLRGVQTGAILAVDGNVGQTGESMEEYDPHRDVVAEAVSAEIEIALRALQRLADEAGTDDG